MKELNEYPNSVKIFAIMFFVVFITAVPLIASNKGIETDIRSLQNTHYENKELIEKAEKSISVIENALEDKDKIFLEMQRSLQVYLGYPSIWLLTTDEAIAFLKMRYISDSMKKERPFSQEEFETELKAAFRRSEILKKEMQGMLDDYEKQIDRARKANVQIEEKIAELQQQMLVTKTRSSSAKSLERITIVEATYGWNCKKFKPLKGANTVEKNNDKEIRSACEGRSTCKYTIDHKKITDPAYGCAKEYDVTYKCMPSGKTFTKNVAKEAGWGDKTIELNCP